MTVSPETIRDIALRSLRLHELIEEPDEYPPVATSAAVIDDRVARWRAATGGEDAFAKRLRFAGLDLAAAVQLVSDRRLGNGWRAPPWCEVLSAIVEATRKMAAEGALEREGHAPRAPAVSEQPLPFEDVLAPCVIVARGRLVGMLKARSVRLDALVQYEALRQLERTLLGSLVALCHRALGRELEVRTRSDAGYRRFVGCITADGLEGFFARFPALARLVGETVLAWVKHQARFLERLEEDRPQLEEVFGRPTGRIATLHGLRSDPHHGQATVQIVRFESGLGLVYKPKSVASEVVWHRFLERLKSEGFPLEMRAARALARSGYGWTEEIIPAPMADPAAVRRFFQRCGAMVCLLHLLRATDGHAENFIAAGEHFVLIDTETLMHGEPRPLGTRDDPPPEDGVTLNYLSSILRSRILPHWIFDRHGNVYDASALGSTARDRQGVRSFGWRGANSDQMRWAELEVTLWNGPNVPRLGAEPLDARDYVADIVAGFSTTYRFILGRRDLWLSPGGPLEAFSRLTQRYVFRETKIYWKILWSSLTPEKLKSGLSRSIEIDKLSRAFLYDVKPGQWPILECERRALERGDIPLFENRVNSTALTSGLAEPLPNVLLNRPYATVRRNFETMSEMSGCQQGRLIESAFHAIQIRPIGAASFDCTLPELDTSRFSGAPALAQGACARLALEIADRIRDRAMLADDGSAGWITPVMEPGSDRYCLRLMPEGLYAGTYGVAVFLAAADRFRGSRASEAIIRGLLRPLIVSEDRVVYVRDFDLGLGGGLASLIYSLCAISRAYNDPLYAELALEILPAFSDGRVAEDKVYDLLFGAAGAILALTVLFEMTGDARVPAVGRRLGEHIVAGSALDPSGHRAWRTVPHVPRAMTGFSHGAAGIALALLRLAAITGDERFLQASCEAVAFERAVFDPELGNWPDFRSRQPGTDRVGAMTSWCNGAAGIGLMRTACIGTPLADGKTADEIRTAVRAAGLEMDIASVDQVCCGNFGRIELRLEAGRCLGDETLLASAYAGAAALARRAEQTEGFMIYRGMPGNVFDPRFFQGLSGVGHALLRLADPDRTPSVLLFE